MAEAIAADGRIVIVGGGVGGAHACRQTRWRVKAPLAIDNSADVAQTRVAIGSGIGRTSDCWPIPARRSDNCEGGYT